MSHNRKLAGMRSISQYDALGEVMDAEQEFLLALRVHMLAKEELLEQFLYYEAESRKFRVHIDPDTGNMAAARRNNGIIAEYARNEAVMAERFGVPVAMLRDIVTKLAKEPWVVLTPNGKTKKYTYRNIKPAA